MLNLSFYITLLLLSLNQLVSVSKSEGMNIYLFDIAIALFSFLGVVYFALVKKSLKIPKNSFLFGIFSVFAIASLVFSFSTLEIPAEDFVVSAFYLFRFFSYLLSGVVVFNMMDKKLITKEKIFKAFIYSGVFLAVIGFIQLLVLPDFTVLDPELGWDPHKNRLASTFFDPNFVGAYFVICLVLLLEKFFPEKRKGDMDFQNLKHTEDFAKVSDEFPKPKKGDFIAFLIIFTALVLTFSRSAWGMLGVAILLYGLFRSRVLLIAAFIVVFLAYFAIPRVQTRLSGITDPADSASLRLVSWRNALEIVKDNFWTGVGFNSYRYAQEEYGFLDIGEENVHSATGSDSSLLFVFATTGILGFLSYFLALIFPLFGASAKKGERSLISASVILPLLLESQFINSLFYPQIMFLVFCVLFIDSSNI